MNLFDAAGHHAFGALAFFISLLGSDSGILRALRHFLRGGGHFVDRRCHLIGLVALTLHRLIRALRLIRDLRHQPGELRGHLGDLPHQSVNLVDEAVERAGQFAEFVLTGDVQTTGQIALARRDVIEVGLHQRQRTQNGIGQQHARRRDHQQHHHRDANDAQHHALHAFLHLRLHQRHLRFDAVKIDRGTDRHVPLRQVFGVPEFRHQHLRIARQRRAVLQIVRAVLRHFHQTLVDVDAVRVAVVLEAFAHALRVVGLEQAHGLGVVAEEVAVLAVANPRQQFDRLRARRFIAGGGSVVERFDRGHGHGDVTLQGGFRVAEQALAGLLDLVVRLLLKDEQRGQADDQRKEQHRENGEGQDFSLEAQAHWGLTLLVLLAWLKALTARTSKS